MFARLLRLRRSHDIVTVLRKGIRRTSGPIICHLSPTTRTPRVTVIVDKKVSKLATERNLLKRQIRGALREIGLPSKYDLVVRALPGATKSDYSQIRNGVAACLREK